MSKNRRSEKQNKIIGRQTKGSGRMKKMKEE
jgi:hypothetical protein